MKQILSISPFLRVKSAMHLASLLMATLLLAACGGGGGGGGGGASAPALATNLNSVQSGIAISWTNPAGVRSVTITRIDYSSADATGTPQPSVTHNNVTGDSTLIAAGRITLNITGTTPNRYYSFNITRGYDGGRTDTLVSARQYLPPAAISNLSPSWNTDTTEATLRWSNPQNVAGITGIRVTRNEFASFAAIAPLRTVTTIARDATAIASTNTGATGAILDITEQVTNRYYTFTVTPIYTGNVEGPTSAVTTPRLYFPPATADAVTATLGEGNTSVLLSWDNPQNVAGIVGVRIIGNEFANATTNVFTTSRYDESDATAIASTNTEETAATFNISTGLNADSYYTFTVAPVYAGGNLVGPASSASNRVGPIGSSFETLTASLDSSGSVILTFTNPDGVTSISATHNRFADSTTDTVADTTISSSAKSAATATNALIDDIPGLTADSYYEFTISRNLAAGDPIDSNPSNRLYIPPATTITNVMATLNSDATGAQLNWTNPANIAGITAVRITRQRYLSADGVAVVDPFSETLTDASAIATSTTEAVAASIAIPNLNHNHYYTFTVTPIYTGAVAGAESVATARLYVPPTAEGFLSLAATLDTDKTGLALRWVNPPNAVGIESIRITHQAYSTADGVAVGDPVITTTTAASAIASTTGGDAFANFDLASLPVNRYYTYTVTPTYTGGLVGPESAPSSLRYYIPPAIGGVTASLNAAKNSADLSWDNPQNAAGITEVRIKITLFNEATGGSSFVGIVDLTSSHPLAIASTNAGTMSASVNLTTPFASNLYYEFTVTPVYAGNVVGTTSAATTPRVYAPPATGALTAVPINSDSAVLLSWTNPTNAAGITAIRITSQGYDAATGGNTDGGANSMLYTEISDTESSNLMPVTNSRQLSIGENGIEADKHYEFTITPIYTGGTEGPTSAATTPRVVLLGLPSVRDLSAAASDAVVRLTWTNPADVLGVTIAYTSGGSTTTIVDNANTENLIRQGSKAFHDVQGLTADTSYTFSVTPRYAGDVDGIVRSTSPISLRSDGFIHSDIDSIPDAEDIDRDGDGLIEIYNVNDLNLVRDDLTGASFAGNSSGCGGGFDSEGLVVEECDGYELMAHLDLNDLESDLSQVNWEPIGFCFGTRTSFSTGISVSTCPTNAFTGTFDGNDYNIRNMRVKVVSSSKFGAGLFGSTDGSELRNIILTNASLTYASTTVKSDVIGGLVGNARNTRIVRSAVELYEVTNRAALGGLVGRSDNVQIISSSAIINDALSGDVLGAMIGRAGGSDSISSSIGVVRALATEASAGGLVGELSAPIALELSLDISFSLAAANFKLSKNGVDARNSGGLLGLNTGDTFINASYVLSASITSGINNRGGIIGGAGTNFGIESSYYNVTSFSRTPNNIGTALNAVGDQPSLQPSGFSNTGAADFTSWGQGWCDTTTGEFTQNRTSDLATGVNANGVPAWDIGAGKFPVPACTPFSPEILRTAIDKVRNDEDPVPIN